MKAGNALRIVTCLCVLGTGAWETALAGVEVDNFDAPPNGGFNNPRFSHAMESPYFSEGWCVSPQWALGLVAANEDNITFNLGPGEYVDWAGVYISSNNATAEFEAIGTQGSYLATWRDMEWRWFDSRGTNIGEITAIRLMGFESSFDDVTISVLPVQVPGDANGDNKIDGADLALWQQHYDPLGLNSDNNTWAMGDWNLDNKIDGADLALWQQNYDPIGPGGASALDLDGEVPEPGTLSLLVLGGLALLSRRRK